MITPRRIEDSRKMAALAWVAGVLAMLCVAHSARASGDIWRLAGSFNGWSASDEAWTMRPDPERTGVFVLDRPIDAGSYEFKFVKNGDWSAGHFGVAVAGGTGGGSALDQPGANIPLVVHAPGIYRITLDLARRSWSFDIGTVSRATLVARVYGTPKLRQPSVRIDASRSLLPPGAGEPANFMVRVVEGRAQVRSEANAMRATVIPNDPGPLVLEATLEFGEQRDSERIDLMVPPMMMAALQFPRGVREKVLLEPGEVGRLRATFEIRQSVPLLSASVHELTEGVLAEQATPPDTQIPGGTYVVEADFSGEPVFRSDDGSPLPTLLHPGEWLSFSLPWKMAEDASRVHLVGDFNGWAKPGEPGAIELIGVLDQGYEATVRLARGAHRYGFLLDGHRIINDPSVNLAMPGPGGASVSQVIVGPRASDFPEPEPGAINASAIHHDPLAASDFAAVSESLGLVDLSVTTLPDDAQNAWVHWRASEGETARIVPLRRIRDGSGFDRWSVRLHTGVPVFEYAFRFRDGAGEHTTEWRRATIRVPDLLETPDWAKGAVWYQIFTERFRNGNPLNDPHGPGVFMMNWSDDWYQSQQGEEEQWRPRASLGAKEALPERQGGALYLWIWDRRYGGDLQGVVEKLDYLQELGVNALYFNPLFEGESMHKYDATDFRHIDDNFGNPESSGRVAPRWEHRGTEIADPGTWGWTDADRYFLDVLLPEARARGMRVVLDGVWNHTGREFWAFQDVMRRGADSPYADWFYCEFGDDGKLESWRAWDSPSGWLPKFRQQTNGDLVAPVKEHLFHVTRRWMDPNGDGDPSDGIDGWRLDVPLDVGLPFWADWRAHVKSINPDAVIIAEIWQPADEFIRGNYFDTQMHYPFASAVVDWLAVRPGMPARELGERLDAAFNDMPQTNLIHQNLMGSHDTDRVASMLFNPHRGYDQANRVQDNGPGYRAGRPDERAFEMSRLAAVIQATYLGAPMIYNGDELGMWGADDPTNRKPIPWPDLPPNENPDDAPDLAMLDHFRDWFALRRDTVVGPVLRYGTVRHLDSGRDDVFVFVRELNGVQVIVCVNRGDEPFDGRRFSGVPGVGAVVLARSATYWVREPGDPIQE
ncbi:MAG: alpha-amylase family glycosyl hydrolase [Phycisphaerales bacterium]